MKRFITKYVSLLLATLIIVGGMTSCVLANQEEPEVTAYTPVTIQAPEGTIFMHTGSPLILSGETIKPLDSKNLDVAATVKSGRTLVPLRAVSEHFGANVSYDETSRTAIISYGGVEYLFPIDASHYVIKDGNEKTEVTMDVTSQILNDRTMLPVRVISEDILGKQVGYFERIISISDTAVDLEGNKDLVKSIKDRIGSALKPNSEAEVKMAMNRYENEMKLYMDGGVMREDAAVEEAAPAEATSNDSAGDGFSETNVQVEGVDEADIIKTDGKYIYYAGSNVVRIVKADQGKMQEAGIIRMALSKHVREIYLDNDRLVVLGNRYEQEDCEVEEGNVYEKEVAVAEDMMICPPYYYGKNFSYMDVYDVSNPDNPMLIKGHEMEGYYESSRKVSDVVYLITSTHPYGDGIMPLMRETTNGQKATEVKLDDVMIMPEFPASGYLVVSALDIQTNDTTEVEAIAASGYDFYMNTSGLYIAGNDYEGNSTIIKFALDGLNVGYAGSTKVKGDVLNQFSMDESNGYFRVATTIWGQERSNALYVLDESLNIVGSVPEFATGERIYSVRFMGDKAYVVTFRNIDPLFVFDLSDPTDPTITGELKVPGFSNYLHPVGEDLILGLGRETYELFTRDEKGKETAVGFREGGIKCSLFDVSDMGKPKEVTKLVIGSSGSYSEALYNHKAIMIDSTNEIMAFDAWIRDDDKEGQSEQQAVLVSFADRDLEIVGTLKGTESEAYGSDIPYGRRVMYIGDYLYYIQDGVLVSYHYETLKKVDTLAFQ